jgi:hypothetical protein
VITNIPIMSIVVALRQFQAIEIGDLSLVKNAQYTVIEYSQEQLWWKVQDQHGNVGYIPSIFVSVQRVQNAQLNASLRNKSTTDQKLKRLLKYNWFVGDMSGKHAESLLNQNGQKGCFVVRKSSEGFLTLSLLTKT